MEKFTRYIFITCTAALALYLQFAGLGELPVVQWDESRLAVNAAEMHNNGNFLVTTYDNRPDLYNTKPPLMIWLQVLCSYVFGLNEFSIRLPSAIAGALCIFLCGWVTARKTKNIYYGCFASLLLASSGGFIQLHGSMTGDYDALLALFVFLTLMHQYRYVYKRSGNALMNVFVFLSLAIMTKSAAAVLVFPVLFTTALMRPDRKRILSIFIVCFLSLIPFLIYVCIREIAVEGYMEAIWNNDFLGRFSKALEGHTSEWYYYVVNLFTFRYSFLVWLMIPALALAFILPGRALRHYSVAFLTYLLFLSLAQTRIHWYDLPLLPLISVIIPLAIHSFAEWTAVPAVKAAVPVILLAGIYFPLREKYLFIRYREGLVLDPTHYELSEMLRNHDDNQQVLYLANWYDAEFFFYTRVNPNIRRGKFRMLRPNDVVMHGNLYKDSVNLFYTFKTLDSTANARKILIQDSRK